MSNIPPDDIKPLSKREEERLLKAGRSVFSTAFPNPKREGCPPPEVIEAIARRKVDIAQHRDFVLHMSRCSPCFNDFSDFQRAAERDKRRKVFAAAAVVIVVCVATWFVVRTLHRTSWTYEASYDLRDRLNFRGERGKGQQSPGPMVMRRGIGKLSFDLPSGSRTGAYQVGVLEESGKPLTTAMGTATVKGNMVVLQARLDLSDISPGNYWLGIRLPGVDWSYYPMVVR